MPRTQQVSCTLKVSHPFSQMLTDLISYQRDVKQEILIIGKCMHESGVRKLNL